MKNQPKTWNELLDTGYVSELSEEQVAIAREKLNPTPDFKFRTPDEDLEKSNAADAKLRGLK